MLAASSGKRNGVCKSAYLSGRHTHHDSPGGNIRRGQRKFQPDNKKDRHACWFQISLFSGTLPALFRWWLTFQVQLQALEYFISMLLAVCLVCGCNIHIITIKPRRLYAVHRCDIYFYLYDVARRLCLCVCVCLGHTRLSCAKNSWTDRDAVWVFCGSKEPSMCDGGPDYSGRLLTRDTTANVVTFG